MARRRAERASRDRGQVADGREGVASEHREGVPSRAAILGHPVHPMLIPFPIAFLTGLLATDIAWWQSRDAFWARVSAWLLEAGLLTGLVAALVGLIDFIGVRRVRQHRAGWIHLLSAIVAGDGDGQPGDPSVCRRRDSSLQPGAVGRHGGGARAHRLVRRRAQLPVSHRGHRSRRGARPCR